MAIDNILAQIDSEIARLQQARKLLSSIETGSTTAGRKAGKTAAKPAKKRKISAEGRRRIAEAQRKRWAAQRAKTKKKEKEFETVSSREDGPPDTCCLVIERMPHAWRGDATLDSRLQRLTERTQWRHAEVEAQLEIFGKRFAAGDARLARRSHHQHARLSQLFNRGA
jgi:hypothetical protein